MSAIVRAARQGILSLQVRRQRHRPKLHARARGARHGRRRLATPILLTTKISFSVGKNVNQALEGRVGTRAAVRALDDFLGQKGQAVSSAAARLAGQRQEILMTGVDLPALSVESAPPRASCGVDELRLGNAEARSQIQIVRGGDGHVGGCCGYLGALASRDAKNVTRSSSRGRGGDHRRTSVSTHDAEQRRVDTPSKVTSPGWSWLPYCLIVNRPAGGLGRSALREPAPGRVARDRSHATLTANLDLNLRGSDRDRGERPRREQVQAFGLTGAIRVVLNGVGIVPLFVLAWRITGNQDDAVSSASGARTVRARLTGSTAASGRPGPRLPACR